MFFALLSKIHVSIYIPNFHGNIKPCGPMSILIYLIPTLPDNLSVHTRYTNTQHIGARPLYSLDKRCAYTTLIHGRDNRKKRKGNHIPCFCLSIQKSDKQ